MKMATIDNTIKKWESKRRRMGCVDATNFFCKRNPNFYPERLTRYTKEGEIFEHVIATDGKIRIDFAPYMDKPDDE